MAALLNQMAWRFRHLPCRAGFQKKAMGAHMNRVEQMDQMPSGSFVSGP